MTHPPDHRPPDDLSHAELLDDLAGYVFGAESIGYRPERWRELVRRWLETPRGAETLERMALTRDGPCSEPSCVIPLSHWHVDSLDGEQIARP